MARNEQTDTHTCIDGGYGGGKVGGGRLVSRDGDVAGPDNVAVTLAVAVAPMSDVCALAPAGKTVPPSPAMPFMCRAAAATAVGDPDVVVIVVVVTLAEGGVVLTVVGDRPIAVPAKSPFRGTDGLEVVTATAAVVEANTTEPPSEPWIN